LPDQSPSEVDQNTGWEAAHYSG